MEDRRPGPEQVREDKISPRGGEFLTRWFKRFRTPEAPEESAEPENPKKSRAKRLFNRIFPSIAIREQIKESEAPRPTLYESFETNWARNREAAPGEHPSSTTDARIDAEPAATAIHDTKEQGTSLSDGVPLSRETSEPDGEQIQSSALPPVEAPPQPNPAIMEELQMRDQPERQTMAASAATLYERRPAAATTERTVTDVEPGTSDRFARSLIGLEYIGRHRADAKLKKADKRMQKDVASLSKKIEADMKSGEELARLASSSKEQIEELRQKRERVAAPKAEKAPVTTVESRPIPPKTPEVRAVSAKPESYVSTERIALRPEVKISPERPVPKPEVTTRPRPEVILERVAKAAERDDPIESAYERRHEIKDEPRSSLVAAAAGPVRIGTILPSAIHPESALIAQPGAGKPKNGTAAANAPPMYKQAATSGFWTALIIIVIITIISITNL